MALYTNESRERVRVAVDMLDLVGARTELRRAGANSYTGLCPFHDERTPSFSVNPLDKVYYCFGCQAKGDLFTFAQETEGLDFKASLEWLAERYGVTLELEDEDPRAAEKRRRRERLLELLERTTAYYERYLWESAEAGRARAYLQGRGLAEEVLREFRVGYAPSAWDRVLLASRRGGFSEQELYETGLAQRSQGGKPYDRFRERIMFPLADVRGRVLGFGARAMRDNQQPKYLNTADGAVYHKGRQLYGADLARAAAAKSRRMIVCEGYTDVIALRQAGLHNTVGIMGTALTDEQVGELARLVGQGGTVLTALDADSAGQEAMLRASRMATQRGLELRVVPLPEGTDPAELAQTRGAEAIGEQVELAVPSVEFLVDRVLARGDAASPEGRDRMREQLHPVFAELPASSMRDELVRRVAGRLELKDAVLDAMLKEAPPRSANGDGSRERSAGGKQPAGGPGTPRAGGRTAVMLDRRDQTERTFLAMCIALPEHGRAALDAVDLEEHFTSALVRRAAAHLREHLKAPTEGIDEVEPELASLIAELTVRAGRGAPRPAVLEMESLQLELARIDRHIRAARAEGRDVPELASERARVKESVDAATDRAMDEG